MIIKCVEIGNFRKLRAVRIDFAEEKTVFVGANNSGKTSAMVALRRFLVESNEFTINDFTLCNWRAMNALGEAWERALEEHQPLPVVQMNDVLPFLDVWLQVASNELHYVQKLLPTLDWAGGALGVRLRFEPKETEALQHEYLKARGEIKKVLQTSAMDTGTDAATPTNPRTELPSVERVAVGSEGTSVPFWPQNLIDFLGRKQRLRALFTIKAYLLDPAQLLPPDKGNARPQEISATNEPVDPDPFKGLIKVDEISAQRGFGHSGGSSGGGDEDGTSASGGHGGRRLSTQLRNYYANHLDPSERPEPQDIEALQALHGAERAFESRLNQSFAGALKELEEIGYPGVTDPKLTISTRIKAIDGLNHGAAVQYEVPTHSDDQSFAHRLPEDSNGLGYQNLVSMVFALMSFRDRWMRVGKASLLLDGSDAFIAPLHLVLIEEPEAYLHAQVQQVFINKAYEILRKHTHLGDSEALRTQMIVSTHSSHLAHECDFSSLRYFRRMPASQEPGAVPLTTVVNLSEVFGGTDPTRRFVKRYLKATHCDLFFADAAVLVEGPAERMLIPHFVRERPVYAYLRRCYMTWLDIGGSHAHTLRPLLEHLGLTTLVITDLDAKASDSNAAVPPRRGMGHRSRNHSLKTWLPGEESIDALLDMPQDRLLHENSSGYAVRVAYQQPVKMTFKGSRPEDVYANTFEDALLYENIDLFSKLDGDGLIRKFREALADSTDAMQLSDSIHGHLAAGGKAELALELLCSDEMDNIRVPSYIDDGLCWLTKQLKRREEDIQGMPKGAA